MSRQAGHKLLSPGTKRLLNEHPSAKVVFRIKELCDQRGISVRELAFLTGIRYPTLTELAKGTRDSITFDHLLAISIVLGVTDMSELMCLAVDDNDAIRIEERRAEPVNNDSLIDMETNRRYIDADKKGLSVADLETLYNEIRQNVAMNEEKPTP